MLPRYLQLFIIACVAMVSGMTAFVLLPRLAHAPIEFFALPQSADRDAPIVTQPTATITFVGDIMLAREVEKTLLTEGADWPFALIKDEWKDSDLVVGNYEATIRDTYRDEGSVLAFDVLPELNEGLKNAGFTHLSLANNHGDDFGAAVTAYTRETIGALGIMPFGDPVESQLYVERADAGGIPLSFVGFHAFLEEPATIAEAIAHEDAQGRFVIVFPHWGNEYQALPSPAQRDAAQMFVDAGADLIIGAHPHVVEPIELVDGVPVAWSLGNFIFDQDWSRETMEGLMLHVTLTSENIAIAAVPVDVVNRQASVMTSERTQAILTAIGAPEGVVTFPRADQNAVARQ